MKIIACCKAAPDDQDIIVDGDRHLCFDKAAWKWGTYDLNAVEAARQLADATEGQVSGLSIGAAAMDTSKLRKDVISRGLDDLYLVADDALVGADSYQTARALAAAVEQMDGFDLVICGAGSSDVYSQQVGNQLGEILELPVVNAVNRVTPGDGNITVERVLENEIQVLEIPLPAVISVTSSINEPRIPGMKDILAAGKKPVTVLALTGSDENGVVASSEVISILAPEQMDRALDVAEGASDEAVERFAQTLAAAL